MSPMYMGNTRLCEVAEPSSGDHPHTHGEYRYSWSAVRSSKGSPPYTWGIRTLPSWIRIPSRITPTYMGNTFTYQLARLELWDHPHIHGEYPRLCMALVTYTGSPPHTWGIPTWLLIPLVGMRITPTYMGNTAVY